MERDDCETTETESWPDDGIRSLYETSRLSVSEICRTTGIARQRLYRMAREQNWRMRGIVRRHKSSPDHPDTPPPGEIAAAVGASDAGEQDRLIARLYREFERQVGAIENRFAETGDHIGDDVDTRRLSALVQTLKKLNELEASAKTATADGGEGGDDIEGLRAELARRMARLCGKTES